MKNNFFIFVGCLLLMSNAWGDSNTKKSVENQKALNKACPAVVMQNIKEEKKEEFLNTAYVQDFKNIGNKFGFECLGAFDYKPNMTTTEFINPGDNVKSWKELLTVQMMTASYQAVRAKDVRDGMVDLLIQNQVKAQAVDLDDSAARNMHCYEYSGTSPGQNQSAVAPEYAFGCVMRVSQDGVMIIIRQSREPLNESVKNIFVKNIKE